MNQSPIEPSLGRIVWFRCNDKVGFPETEYAAIITKVYSTNCVALTVFKPSGNPVALTSILFSDDMENSDGQHLSWRWMPYQLANKPA